MTEKVKTCPLCGRPVEVRTIHLEGIGPCTRYYCEHCDYSVLETPDKALRRHYGE